jgi:hypothetical protein
MLVGSLVTGTSYWTCCETVPNEIDILLSCRVPQEVCEHHNALAFRAGNCS